MRHGPKEALVVSNWEMAKECLMKTDKVCCNRGTSIATEVLCYDYAMFPFAPYGPYWRQLGKTATQELLYTQGFEMLKKVVETEVCQSIKEVYEKSASANVKVDLKKWFRDVYSKCDHENDSGEEPFQ